MGKTANTEGYGQYTLRSFSYSGYYLFLQASQINMWHSGKRSRRKESSKVWLILCHGWKSALFWRENRFGSGIRQRLPAKTLKHIKLCGSSLPSAVSIMLERLCPRVIPLTTAFVGRSTRGPLAGRATAVTSGGGALFSEGAAGGEHRRQFESASFLIIKKHWNIYRYYSVLQTGIDVILAKSKWIFYI